MHAPSRFATVAAQNASWYMSKVLQHVCSASSHRVPSAKSELTPSSTHAICWASWPALDVLNFITNDMQGKPSPPDLGAIHRLELAIPVQPDSTSCGLRVMASIAFLLDSPAANLASMKASGTDDTPVKPSEQ